MRDDESFLQPFLGFLASLVVIPEGDLLFAFAFIRFLVACRFVVIPQRSGGICFCRFVVIPQHSGGICFVVAVVLASRRAKASAWASREII
jgi:hypothetical protein